ncbi:MAG TPA: hypothetical protein ENM97_02050 [Moorella mulderi]|nr:hypothetical protein [Moorella mulderi]
MASWRQRIEAHWSEVHIEKVEELPSPPLKVGSSFEVQATVFLGSLDPGEVQVALYYGPLDPRGKIKEGQKVLLAYKQDLGEGRHLYQGEVLCRRGGAPGVCAPALSLAGAVAALFVRPSPVGIKDIQREGKCWLGI